MIFFTLYIFFCGTEGCKAGLVQVLDWLRCWNVLLPMSVEGSGSVRGRALSTPAGLGAAQALPWLWEAQSCPLAGIPLPTLGHPWRAAEHMGSVLIFYL